jgi:4-amino-4-deoxy-L-arabinose transferase-like glycosyltransferase
MNWRRGLLRAWILLATLWVIMISGLSFMHWYTDVGNVVSVEQIVRSAPNIVPQWDLPDHLKATPPLPTQLVVQSISAGMFGTVLIIFGPPLALLLIGVGAYWVAKGFII